jgi:hypothetical protein
MRRVIAAFLVLAAACSGDGGLPPESTPGSISARFPPGGAQDVIEVTMRDRMVARTVALIGPNGLVQSAYTIETRPIRQSAREYGGVAPGVPVFGIAGAPSTSMVTDEAVTTAFIQVPDVFEYRRNWQAYRIRLEIGTPPDRLRAVAVAAPPPAN